MTPLQFQFQTKKCCQWQHRMQHILKPWLSKWGRGTPRASSGGLPVALWSRGETRSDHQLKEIWLTSLLLASLLLSGQFGINAILQTVRIPIESILIMSSHISNEHCWLMLPKWTITSKTAVKVEITLLGSGLMIFFLNCQINERMSCLSYIKGSQMTLFITYSITTGSLWISCYSSASTEQIADNRN